MKPETKFDDSILSHNWDLNIAKLEIDIKKFFVMYVNGIWKPQLEKDLPERFKGGQWDFVNPYRVEYVKRINDSGGYQTAEHYRFIGEIDRKGYDENDNFNVVMTTMVDKRINYDMKLTKADFHESIELYDKLLGEITVRKEWDDKIAEDEAVRMAERAERESLDPDSE